MRYALLLLPAAALGLAGCVGVDAGSSNQPSMTVARSTLYLSSEQSAKLMTLPGDTMTPVQLRYLTNGPTHEPDSVQPIKL